MSIGIISGTNRKNSLSFEVSTIVNKMFKNEGVESEVISLEKIPADFMFQSHLLGYEDLNLKKWIQNNIEPYSRFIFIVPEYNGSFPGILKCLLDVVPPELWRGRKVALIGIAAGRGGNGRGVDQLTNILHYLKADVLWHKVLISHVHEMLNNDNLESLHSEFITQAKLLLT